MRLLGGFAGGIDPKGRRPPAFSQVGNADIEQRPRKTAQNPGDHVKIGGCLLRNRTEAAIRRRDRAALRGDIGLTSIVMGTAFVETCDSGGRRQSRMASKRTFARRRTPQKAFARTENPKTAFARWTDPPKPHSPACQPTFSNQCTAAFHRATSRC